MIFIKKLFIFIILFNSSSLMAETTHVYCTNISRDWKWLKNGNKKVTVNGTWKEMGFFPAVFIEYFEPFGGIDKIEELTQACIKQYGEAYYIVQPADNFYSEWNTFGSSNYLLNGLFTIQSHNVSYGYSLYIFNSELFQNSYTKYISYKEIEEKIKKLKIEQSYL